MKILNVVLVDLDNLYIVNNRVNVDILKTRLDHIKTFATKAPRAKILYYGNTATLSVITKLNLGIDLRSSTIEKNSADHNIINDLKMFFGVQKLTIITHDKTLARLAKFMAHSSQKIHFMGFDKTTQELAPFDIVSTCFAKRIDLIKFIESYNLYKRRYLETP
jgi:hypothetical protein